ncbi:MAG: transglutaminase-like domain-containing protein [Anaerolineales bacterium]
MQNRPTRRYIPPPPSRPQISLSQIPKGFLGTQKTVEQMQTLIREGVKDFYLRQKAIDILLEKGVRPKDYLGEIKALFEWVQRNVRYTKDPFRLEVLHSPRRMLELRAGDCDDMAVLLGAMLESIGHPVRLVLVGPNPLRRHLFTHVYLEAYYKGRWIPLDPTMPYPMGWAPRAWLKKMIAIERRPKMLSQDMDLQGSQAAAAVPDWLRGLVRAVRREAMQPRDARVKSLWDLLRQRQLLRRSQWLQGMLRRVWGRGLQARPRPYTTRRLVRLLRRWGILPPLAVARRRMPIRPLRPVIVRPMAARPVRPMTVRPVARAAARR